MIFQVTSLEGFFGEEDVIFFVYGSERANADDFVLDVEGIACIYLFLSSIFRFVK